MIVLIRKGYHTRKEEELFRMKGKVICFIKNKNPSKIEVLRVSF